MFNLFKKKQQANVEATSDKDPVLSVTFKVDTLDIQTLKWSNDDM